jgi:hypothetical protein
MIRLLQNPGVDVQYKLRTYHYVPRPDRRNAGRPEP